ncbi:hypothetical protein [Maridesulfovibrio ferrireducens]|uniref:hypothetical protein n=1 Tax=Maridesulfovibrio ferrireducens TaxID=246191 RepID=UPI001A1F116F|nr:hypothetical protein [Maridesulfovibrio ferrireducens]MBI9111397.1 hypothetical protein [Maridesulfovibrio ferrireducens]
MKNLSFKKCLVLTLLVVTLLAVTGCGVKMWPAPQKSEDTFTFTSVTGRRTGECLKIVVKVDGAFKNVDNLSLQFQADGSGPGEGCPTCPFFPAIRKQFIPGSEGIQSDGSTFVFSECGLDPEKSYRYRVVGRNVYEALGIVISDVYIVTP